MNNVDLNQIQIFAEVAKHSNFSMAAEKLGIEKSTASIKVKQLEQRLGITLFYRTTRKVSLTEAGQNYFQYCQQALSVLDEANDYIVTLSDEPQGKLKVGAPFNLTNVLLEQMLPKYLDAHPKVKLDIIESNRLEDLTEGNFDVVIRSKKSDVADSSLIYRKLFDTNWVIAANVNKLGCSLPNTIQELMEIPYIGCLNESTHSVELHHKTLMESGVTYSLSPRFSVNNMKDAIKAAAKGLGFVIAPRGTVLQYIHNNELVQLLPNYILPQTSLYVVYPTRSGQPAKVSSFVEAIFNWRDNFVNK